MQIKKIGPRWVVGGTGDAIVVCLKILYNDVTLES